MNSSFTGAFQYLRKLCPQQENSALLRTGSYVRMTVMMTVFLMKHPDPYLQLIHVARSLIGVPVFWLMNFS